MKVIFMGSSDFSLNSFKKVYENGYKIQALYTKKPKPKGRGHKVQTHEIYKLAKSLNIPIYTPTSLRKKEVIDEFLQIDADVNIVASYGLILPVEVLYAKKYKSINVHGSLLPKWRGAAPVQRAIESGDKTFGATIIQMDEGIDTGDMLAKESFDLPEDMQCKELFEKTASVGAKLLIDVLKNIDNLKPEKQDESKACYAKMIKKEEAKINFDDSAFNIFNKIRAFADFPKAYFDYKDEQIKILKASYCNKDTKAKAGTVLNENLEIATKQGVVRPLVLQRAGKRALDINEFKKGFTVEQGILLQ